MELDFNKYAEEFRTLNFKDPGTWPLVPKLAALAVILIAIPVVGYFADWQGQMEELDAGRAQETKLKDEYLNKKKQAINLDLHKQQLREIDTQFGALLKQLPNKSQMDALLVDINQAGLGRGLQFELFKPAAAEVRGESFNELPIQLKVTGTYHDMGAFASDVGQLSRIVILKDVAMTAGKDGNLVMDSVARTFRYLDEEEVAAQRRAQQGAKKGAKK
ncbi:MAG: pilus assembly protein PilO [Betaproteobacteria bacterium RIFCSPLOWO2_02_67_12]|nr:MAG: pilus assembly protein PilO [Betaproteobacteria bacterium RIFCSPLOWO2_02_67_12]OGA28526.1 MAG: pilus assembly protein PilO [Betaproteobacteria bacterium RIFCSPLOWO2_02_FULL_68_150]OGA60760.1 MAG: pilus assembly protein PilO [Betaproteobacteria bacterium RIFCSPLOWO2_12_FULL_67_28]